ncbi:hypothetical protein [Streptomyces pseudogriseolus]|uniref:hypothetical protein n=1 Tax=Streptomyces pseudogriseolus TaxID=36817 RepID=UPI0027DF33C9|nr:hypothetical protein [Streptomyces pseudogriseolus]
MISRDSARQQLVLGGETDAGQSDGQCLPPVALEEGAQRPQQVAVPDQASGRHVRAATRPAGHQALPVPR